MKYISKRKRNSYNTCLFHHLVAEDMVTIKDFDGNMVTILNVLSELDLSKASLANGFSQLVLSHAGTRSHGLLPAHCSVPYVSHK